MDNLKISDIMALIDKVAASNLAEFRLQAGGTELVLKKLPAATATAASTAVPAVSVSQPAEEEKVPAAAAAVTSDTGSENIGAPVLGTFYRSSEPGGEPYVNVGSHVEAGQVVGLVEVMKLFNEVKAPAAGEIVAVLAEDGEMVEYGQPLFQLKRA